MKVIIQRVKKASCVVDNKVISQINHGMMLLVGFTNNDTIEEVKKMASKISKLRIFEDENKKMNLSISDVHGSILSISQFTLYANPYEGNRPSFTQAMNPTLANELYNQFNIELEKNQMQVKTGSFGADMKLDIICDGPVTITLEYSH